MIVEETVYLLLEWLSSPSVQGSIAFPEIVVPVIVLLRKSIKGAKTGPGAGPGASKDLNLVKTLLERIDESARWIEQRRKGVQFTPGKIAQVKDWELELKAKVDESPLGKYLKVQRKTREKRRKLVEKVCSLPCPYLGFRLPISCPLQARQGEDEILEE